MNPYLARDMETLERVQQNYTRRVAVRTGMEYTDYPDRLGRLDVSLLSTRQTALENCNHVCRKNFFSCRYRSTWNALPEDIVTASSLLTAKSRLLSSRVP